jgi:hypothetical protein
MLSRAGLALVVLVSQQPRSWDQIVAGESVGPLRKGASERALSRAVGAENLKDGIVGSGEDFCHHGTIAFSNDPDRRMQIIWSDDGHTQPWLVVLSGKTSRMHTPSGIGLGTARNRIEALNGTALTVNEQGSDYGGAITDLNGRRLEGELKDIRLFVGPSGFVETLWVELGPRPETSVPCHDYF